MVAKSKIDQLDPFKDEEQSEDKSEFRTKDIRHSFARTAKNLLINVLTITKRSPHILMLIAGALAVAIIVIIGITIISNSTPNNPGTSTATTPSGQSSGSGGYTPPSTDPQEDPDDPEARAYAQENLSTVIALITSEDWEYAGALIETISPKLLDDCDKLHFYRSIVSISDHFDGLSITKEAAASHVSQLENACVIQNE